MSRERGLQQIERLRSDTKITLSEMLSDTYVDACNYWDVVLFVALFQYSYHCILFLFLEQILIQNQKVEFAGYSVPHPSEPIVHIRVQTHDPTTAVQALQESCETLHEQCEYVLQQLESKLPEVREDSDALQKKMEEMLEEDDEDDDDMMEE